jgi:hypothetical protein
MLSNVEQSLSMIHKAEFKSVREVLQRAIHRDVIMRRALADLLRLRRRFNDTEQLDDVWEAVDQAYARFRRRKCWRRMKQRERAALSQD